MRYTMQSARRIPEMVLCALIVLTLNSCGRVERDTTRLETGDRGQPRIVNVPFNRTTVMSTIIDLNQATYPDYTVRMCVQKIVDQTGIAAFVHEGDTIISRPNFVKDSDGNILLESEVNKGLILIYGMSPGDVVKAVVYYKGDERGREWRLMSCSKNTE